MRRKIIISGLLSTLLAATAAGGIWYAASSPSAALNTASARAVASQAHTPVVAHAAAPLSRAGWSVGTEYVHDLDYRLHMGPPPAQDEVARPVDTGLRISGRWTTLVIAATEPHVLVKVELQDAKVDAPRTGAPEEGLALAPAEFARAFYVTFDSRGRATLVHFPKDMPATAQVFLTHLVSAAQFTAPERPARRWTVTETASNGEYRAEYQAISPSEYTRTKLRYLRLLGRNGLQAAAGTAPIITHDLSRFTLDEQGRVTKLTLATTETTPLNDVGLALQSDGRLTLALVRSGRAPVGPMPETGFVSSPLAHDAGQLAAAGENADRSLVAGASLRDLEAELGRVLSNGDERAISQVQNRLSALFRLEPKAALQAALHVEPKAARALLSAIGFSGTPEAQSALARVMTDARADVDTRLAAVDSVMTVERPTPEMRSALTNIVESGEGALKTNASYMLGVAANRLQEDDAAASQEIVQRMTDDFAAANDTSEQVRIIDSLGNAGTPDALTSIEQGLNSADPGLRDASARALRFVEDPRADELLARTMTEDVSPAVRQGALFSASFRSYGPLATAFETVCKTDRDAGVRQAAVEALANLTKSSGEPLLLLDWVAEHDPDPAVREQARKVLERPQG